MLAAESRKNLITAVGAVLCRHGMLLRLMNLFGGERHAYATTAALSLLTAGTAVQFWWYDIACRWGTAPLMHLGRKCVVELLNMGAGGANPTRNGWDGKILICSSLVPACDP